MRAPLRITVILLTLVACVGCDQATKSIARARLPTGQTISLLDGTVRLQRAENPGAFLSLGDELPDDIRILLFTIGGAVFAGAMMLWALRGRRRSLVQAMGAALIAGGGLGNVIDRVAHGGQVTDFLNIGVGPVHTGIFNVADMALMLGIALVILSAAHKGGSILRS